MNKFIKLSLATASLSLLSSIAFADEPSVKQWATERVQNGLVNRLDSERAKFSRAMPAPRERRVRILSSSLSTDEKGRAFASFEVDDRFGEEWNVSIVGCVYKGSGNIFVKLGEEYRPAEILLGKDVKAVPFVCEARKSSDRA